MAGMIGLAVVVADAMMLDTVFPGQRQSSCPDRGDRSGAGLQSGVLVRGG